MRNPAVTRLHLDYPAVIEMHSLWIEHSDHEVDLPFSATDHAWMERVDASRGMIAIAAGAFCYIDVDDVAELRRTLPLATLAGFAALRLTRGMC